MPISTINSNGLASPLSTAVSVASGGTGLATTPANGQIDIGNGTGFTRTTITAGTNITVTNGAGSITIAAAGGGVTSLNGATGAIVTTTLYALGSFVTGRPENTTNYNVDSTIAGSSITTIGPGLIWNGGGWEWPGQGGLSSGSPANVGVGSWRCVSPTVTGPGASKWTNGLWVRYA